MGRGAASPRGVVTSPWVPLRRSIRDPSLYPSSAAHARCFHFLPTLCCCTSGGRCHPHPGSGPRSLPVIARAGGGSLGLGWSLLVLLLFVIAGTVAKLRGCSGGCSVALVLWVLRSAARPSPAQWGGGCGPARRRRSRACEVSEARVGAAWLFCSTTVFSGASRVADRAAQQSGWVAAEGSAVFHLLWGVSLVFGSWRGKRDPRVAEASGGAFLSWHSFATSRFMGLHF